MSPKTRRQTRQRLGGVTRLVTEEKNGRNTLTAEECPICLGPLYQPRRRSTDTEPGSQGHESETSHYTQLSNDDRFEDDIVALRICDHHFHSACLITWYLSKRYDCPLCRRLYTVLPYSSRVQTYRTCIGDYLNRRSSPARDPRELMF
ncbi:uncharacterized protein K452DRAFT_97483 [Aplosporella prunicola CBS 121167]|uniref:RING-type domain-containing protein n=1 Tax=Aplosporella prunicola CBS 121167 TaxID=1176127 RepID=A0A6A6B353_9PEZI|nr:uncharacterized protein K452DRAFT_97483 [Aplosporella prunicola CBS 121167]KAF2137685.1 hypothetical protein K452DRAFT_97483 [Aplosporella prunicola CBS 121167]